ncbi:MAG: LytTR family DNA-binding domain-containing protein [Bacteroidota bacterium]
MRKDKLYFLTFLSITVIYVIIAGIALHFMVKSNTRALLETHLEFSKKEARTLGAMIGNELRMDVPRDTVVAQLQNCIDGTVLEKGFLSIFDWSGRIVCHPDIKMVGQPAGSDKSFVSSVSDDLNADTFLSLLQEYPSESENEEAIVSEVIHLYPVQNSDWIVAANVNIASLNAQLDATRRNFRTIFLVMGLVVILAYVLIVRLLGSAYEKRLEMKNQKLEDEVINLSKLNRAVGDYKQKVEEQPAQETKKRILTYVRNELLSIPITEIAHVYTENTITYVISFDGRRSTTNLSLDELFSQLDDSQFFRANRQFIIAISSIDKIVKYGNNQLKILVTPESENHIIISKNRASEFKLSYSIFLVW